MRINQICFHRGPKKMEINNMYHLCRTAWETLITSCHEKLIDSLMKQLA